MVHRKAQFEPRVSTVRLGQCLGMAFLFLICLSCGETYRPVANPVIPNPPNPAFVHLITVLSDNGTNNPGAGSTLDVSGDTVISQSQVGLGPAYAAIVSGPKIYAANSLDDTVSAFSPSAPTPVITISLPSSCPMRP